MIARETAGPRAPRLRNRESLSRYLSLVLFKAYADLRSESQRTYVGYLWWVVDPVLSMMVYYVVFDVLFSRGIENYALFLFVALVPWRWFQTTLLTGSGSILHARGLMLQVYLPKVVFPVVTFLTMTAKFLIVYALLVILLPLLGFPFGLHHLGLLVVLLVNGLLILGGTFLTSAFTPFFPDLRMVLENVIRLLFFLSGILYPMEMMPERLQQVLSLNPLVPVLTAYRAVLLEGRWPEFGRLFAVGLFALLLTAVGAYAIHRRDYAYSRIS